MLERRRRRRRRNEIFFLGEKYVIFKNFIFNFFKMKMLAGRMAAVVVNSDFLFVFFYFSFYFSKKNLNL